MRAPILTLCTLLLAGLASGCLERLDQTDPDGPPAPPNPVPARGNMTAQEKTQTTSGVCPGMAPIGSEKPYCAWRAHWIAGELDLAELPITLSTFNGDVQSAGGVGRAWNLTAVLSARGASEAEARTALDNIRFEWSHEEPGGHYLRANANRKTQDSRNHEAAGFHLTVPASVLVALQAQSASGDVTATGLRAQQVRLVAASGDLEASELTSRWLVMSAASGDIRAERFQAEDLNVNAASGDVAVLGQSGVVQIRTASGGVTASLRPTLNASWSLNSASGDIRLKVPEEARFGYSVSASTASGTCSIGLGDGDVSGNERSKRFETQGYASRPLRVKIGLSAASGDVDVSPL